ncbi:zinc finger protein 658B-like [Vespula pensylvanica]|uniref:Uncharacterized protein n=1 Tax=Vespula pensylvanica TaxID=30213 RepID=A0A834JM25_VESPE|nr:zinc finger protein 658B-like [Vespula pensylvanica]KAF7389577.1 hypothetical protein H0235_018061 [Vespula pensylvanica]
MFIVTKEIDGENISKLCRTCLREDGDKMVCLFVGPAGSSLAAKLRSLSCLEVWQGDGLPEKMCDRCVTRAESALLYREQCRAADRALRQAALKVSGLTSYATVSGCKLYQQSQGFMPVQNSHKTLKCIECGAVFMSYQELCAHNRLHLPFVQENIPVEHMHIIESQNTYLNFSHLNSNLSNDGIQNTQLSPLITSNVMHMMSVNEDGSSRAACALHCSLCNHTFTNRTQLICHNIAHTTENIDISCDNDNIDICENSNQLPQNLSYERSMNSVDNSVENLSYQRPNVDNNEMQNLNFPGNIHLDDVRESGTQRVQNIMHSENDVTNVHNLQFTKAPNVETDRHILNNYQACSSDSDYKEKLDAKELSNSHPKRYKCKLCTKVFSQKSKLLAHQISHSDQRPFKCLSCEKAYASKSKLNAHMRLHTKKNVHFCKLCNKIFTYPSYLEEHMKTHNKVYSDSKKVLQLEGFQCNTCKKRFRLIKNLKAHEKLHTGKDLIQCEICDKRFSQNYNLKVHLQTHKSIKMHKCEYCNKCFTQKGNLVEHLRIHTKIKPFECKLCGKTFSQSSHLKNHEASHVSLRQHQCRLCGKRFKLANHLKRHLNLHTGTKTYKCEQCNQMFSQAFSLTRHMKRHSDSHI